MRSWACGPLRGHSSTPGQRHATATAGWGLTRGERPPAERRPSASAPARLLAPHLQGWWENGEKEEMDPGAPRCFVCPEPDSDCLHNHHPQLPYLGRFHSPHPGAGLPARAAILAYGLTLQTGLGFGSKQTRFRPSPPVSAGAIPFARRVQGFEAAHHLATARRPHPTRPRLRVPPVPRSVALPSLQSARPSAAGAAPRLSPQAARCTALSTEKPGRPGPPSRPPAPTSVSAPTLRSAPLDAHRLRERLPGSSAGPRAEPARRSRCAASVSPRHQSGRSRREGLWAEAVDTGGRCTLHSPPAVLCAQRPQPRARSPAAPGPGPPSPRRRKGPPRPPRTCNLLSHLPFHLHAEMPRA